MDGVLSSIACLYGGRMGEVGVDQGFPLSTL